MLLSVVEVDAIAVQPRDGRAVVVESGFAEDRIVAAAVEGDEEPTAGSDFDLAAGFDELAVELLRLGLLEALELTSQPAVATVGDHRQSHVEVDVQADLAGEAIEVEEVDVRSQAVLDAVASGIMGDELAGAHLEVIGQEQIGRASCRERV